MDIHRLIKDLYDERERVSRLIAFFEELQNPGKGPPKMRGRGRKSMSAEERRQVSARIKRYWDQRRAEKSRDGNGSASEPAAPQDASPGVSVQVDGAPPQR